MPDLTAKHPQYVEQSPDWVKARDCYAGQRRIKSRGTTYLSATQGQIEDGLLYGQRGYASYQAYLRRAVYENYLRQSVQIAVGLMHGQPAKISLPTGMTDIRSSRGETLHQLLRRINEEQLTVGRIGLLPDLPSRGGNLPYLATYSAESIINWGSGADLDEVPQRLQFVILDESEDVLVSPDDFQWQWKNKWRVLRLTDGVYQVASGEKPDGSDLDFTTPSIRGRALDHVPFRFINSCDLSTETDEPPLLNLCNRSVAIYRGEADYRQNLFMQGQDTLVLIGFTNEDDSAAIRVGAGANIQLPMGADAKYIGVGSEGLSEQREALAADHAAAGASGAQTLDTVSRERESGTSLYLRIAARTADLTQVALAGGQALEDTLKDCADWLNVNPEQVRVEPNLEFGDRPLTGQSMLEMQGAKNAGWPISARTLHQAAFDRGLTKLSFEDEIAKMKEEETIMPKPPSMTSDRNPEQQ